MSGNSYYKTRAKTVHVMYLSGWYCSIKQKWCILLQKCSGIPERWVCSSVLVTKSCFVRCLKYILNYTLIIRIAGHNTAVALSNCSKPYLNVWHIIVEIHQFQTTGRGHGTHLLMWEYIYKIISPPNVWQAATAIFKHIIPIVCMKVVKCTWRLSSPPLSHVVIQFYNRCSNSSQWN